MLERLRSHRNLLAGVAALVLTAWVCMYGKLWCFENVEAHRFTSRAMLLGTLAMRSRVTLAGHDEQVFHGAVYTNWGFGVPLLQLPFHALASLFRGLHGFFPDRAIYFLYLCAAIPAFWATFDRLLEMRQPPATSPERRRLASWAVTWLVLNTVLFPFMSTRFVVYEETLAYMTICELLALGGYVLGLQAPGWRPAVVMGIASGLGLLVRPTGLVYVGVWGALVALQRRPARTLLFAAAVAPFVAFFLYTNQVRSGSPMGLGFANSNPAVDYHILVQRFGSTCADGPAHMLEIAGRLLNAFFLYISGTPNSAWLRACHFGDFEQRDGTREPYFGPAVLVMLVAFLLGLVRRRERRLSIWVPYAAMAALFAAYVRQGWGFNWRYTGDFWPLLVLAAVQYVHTLPAERVRPLDGRMVKIFVAGGAIALARFLVPWQWSSGGPHGEGRAEIVHASESAAMEQSFLESHAGVDAPLPSRLSCGEPLAPLYKNGVGWSWKDRCGVDAFTNVYLGVPRSGDDRHRLRLRTEGMPMQSVKVFLDGKVYTAEKRGDAYEADVAVRYADLASPVVIATVLWSRDEAVPAGARLLSIELS